MSMRILVADDSPVIRAAVTELLTSNGFEVVPAVDGIDAVQRFYSDLPDLVLLDLQMPGLNGYVACRLIKEDWKVAHIPVIILTAHQSAEDRYWAHKSGADAYVTKDQLGDNLLGAIRSARASRALTELTSMDEREPLDQVGVMTRVCEMLDRQLFEASIVNDIVTLATRTLDLRSTVQQVLQIVRRFVEYDIAGLALREDKTLGIRVAKPVSRDDITQFRALVAGHLEQATSAPVDASGLTVWLDEDAVVDPEADTGGLPSFWTLALRSRSEVLGILALGSAKSGLYTPQIVRTLRMVEFPMSMVVESAFHHQKMLEQEARMSLSALYQRS